MRRRGPWKRDEERKWSTKAMPKLRENPTAIPCLGESRMVTLIAPASQWILSIGVMCQICEIMPLTNHL